MNQLQIFENQDFGRLRTVMVDGEPWFVAADVCRALEISNTSQAITRLDDDEKGVILNDTPGGKQEMSTVNEPGFYTLVFGSRKPEAKAFKRWVTHEVLPTLRKTGSYEISTPTEIASVSKNAHHPLFGDVRIVVEGTEILFCVNDVCRVLKFTNQQEAVKKYCLPVGQMLRTSRDARGRTQNMLFIDEGNLIRLIEGSNNRIAKNFECWIYYDILPFIRNNGIQTTPQIAQEIVESINVKTLWDTLEANIKERRIMMDTISRLTKILESRTEESV